MNASNVIYVDFRPTTTLKDASQARETASRNKELAKELKKAIISNNFSSTKAILQTPQIYVDPCMPTPSRGTIKYIKRCKEQK